MFNLDEIPNVSKVRASIENLKKFNFPKFEETTAVESYVDSVIKKLHTEFGFALNMIQPMIFKKFPTKLFRVRDLDSITNIDLYSEHSYPPVSNVKMGRCNFPRNPVFYCSIDPKIALFEVSKSNTSSRDYCISKWELVKTNQKLFLEYFIQIPLQENNDINLLKDNLKNRVNEPFLKSYDRKLDKEQEQGVIEYRKYLDSCFINDNDYSISASLAHNSLYASHNYKTDILIYPSVQTSYLGINLAIRPNFVDNNLRLKRLYVVRLNNHNVNVSKIRIEFLRIGETRYCDIQWRNVDINKTKDKRTIAQDFGEF
jgi:hypothetical protein